MAMMRKTITIPDAMEDWIKTQINSGRYGNDSEYFRDLIRRDQDRLSAKIELQSLIEEGISSGISSKNAEEIRRDVLERLRKNGQLPAWWVRNI